MAKSEMAKSAIFCRNCWLADLAIPYEKHNKHQNFGLKVDDFESRQSLLGFVRWILYE